VENVRHLNRDRDAADGAGGFERVPPQDLDAEQAVLGAMFYGPQAIDDAAAVMDPADHYRPAHETIHRAILALHAAGEPVDPVLLGAYLGKTGELARVGGTAYLHTLANAGHLASLAQQYAEIVHEKAVRRRVVEAGLHIAQLSTRSSPRCSPAAPSTTCPPSNPSSVTSSTSTPSPGSSARPGT
jgi:replicative DNA helicase